MINQYETDLRKKRGTLRKPDGIVRDGETINVPMMFMDSVQRGLAEKYNMTDDKEALAEKARQTAYLKHRNSLADAWKKPPTDQAPVVPQTAYDAYKQRLENAYK